MKLFKRHLGIIVLCLIGTSFHVFSQVKDKQVVFYLQNLPYERIGAENDAKIINDLEQDFKVITVDCSTYPKTSPELEEALMTFHIESPKLLVEHFTDTEIPNLHVYYVPEGYTLKANIPVWNLKEHGAEGTIDYVMNTYNKEVVAKHGIAPVSDPDDMIDKFGNPIDYNLYMHLIYPSGSSTEKVPLVINFATIAPSQRGFNPVKPREATQYRNIFPLGFLTSGYAWAHVDHCYNPLAREEVWGYFDRYSLEDWNGLAANTAYIRYLKLHKDQYNLNGKIGIMGISKASYGVIRIANTNNAEGSEHFLFNNTPNTKSQPWQGVDSKVDVAWAAAGLGTMRISKYVDEHTVPLITSVGRSDQYGHWPLYPEVERHINTLDVNHLSFWMEDLGHDYPCIGTDFATGSSRYLMFRSFFNNYLKPENERFLKVLSAYPKEGTNDIDTKGLCRILPHDGLLPQNMMGVSAYSPITIRFLSEVDLSKVRQYAKVLNVGTSAEIQGIWTVKKGGMIFEFEPKNELEKDETYKIFISPDIEDKSGKKIEKEFVREFTISRDQEITNYTKIFPTDDTFQKLALGNTPNGESKTLRVRYSQYGDWRFNTYLKFTISDIASENIKSAKVKLASERQVDSNPIKLTIQQTETGWGESTLVSSNKPTVLGSTIDQITFTGEELWNSFDVTGVIKSGLNSGENLFSFIIQAGLENTDYAYFHSKEAENSAFHPYIEIEEIDNSGTSVSDFTDEVTNLYLRGRILTYEGDHELRVNLLDVSGKGLFSTDLSTSKKTVDLSRFRSGIYFVQYHNKQEKGVLKLIL